MSKKFTLDLTTGKGVESDLTTDEQKILDDESKAYADAAPARALERLREKRNILLVETDHFALSDQTLTDNMKTYRQELRDITEGLDTVKKCQDVTWPDAP
jgi:maltodextrin utilization protein YvdJ|tara:strand:+ start:1960 stop:2262 length:303 start_codon:yes stop_codon:yes gene_type:complete